MYSSDSKSDRRSMAAGLIRDALFVQMSAGSLWPPLPSAVWVCDGTDAKQTGRIKEALL